MSKFISVKFTLEEVRYIQNLLEKAKETNYFKPEFYINIKTELQRGIIRS